MVTRVKVINADKPSQRLLERAARLILKNEVIVCPTDTGYAFVANALEPKAVVKVFNLKGRAYSNPIHVAVNSVEAAESYAQLNTAARYLAHKFLPGALTMVLARKEIIPALLVAGRDTVGIRIPDNRVILGLAAMTGLPLTATSANISGKPTPYSVPELVSHLGETIENVALVLDQGPLPIRELSTIIDLTVSPPQLLRQGRISWIELWQGLQALPDDG